MISITNHAKRGGLETTTYLAYKSEIQTGTTISFLHGIGQDRQVA